jgi:hypothetical protein
MRNPPSWRLQKKSKIAGRSTKDPTSSFPLAQMTTRRLQTRASSALIFSLTLPFDPICIFAAMAQTPHPADDDARPFAMGLRLLFVVVALAAIVVAVVIRHGWR